MNNNNHKSSIRKSSSLSSLNQRTTFDNSILTSTKNLEFILPNYNKDDRRKSIMATPYRSKNIQGFNIMNNTKEQQTSKQKLILRNDGYESDKNLRISRNLYFEAILLLVEGDAKRKYIKNRKQILSFDDFYEFLLLQFDIIDTSISSPNPPQVVNNDFSKPYSSISNKTIDNQTENTTYFSDTINISRQTPTFNSTAKVDFGVINIIAFKRLETYTQEENQAILNFFNEVLKLYHETDSTISEATKLKNLLNETKPSIQYEVLTTTFISEKTLHHMTHLHHIRKRPDVFVLADGVAHFQVFGLIHLLIRFSNSIIKIEVHIAQNLYTDMILDTDYINMYNLNIEIKQQIVSIKYKNHIYTMSIDKDFESIKIPVTSS
ncbi:unnamed protein product [Rotaria sordida]|uniref:Uncharacterized protein n=2 Tax=Rotaria sordida TaxID=392033 RepID=A0A819PGY1_9BILA|nr:unnamed protein product [Rotaria sordida]